MNYGPFMGTPYYSLGGAASRGGLFSRLLGGFNFGSIISNTQKTLGLVNQAIPVIKQIKPVIGNAKTMFKVMNEFKKTDEVKTTNINNTKETKKEEDTNNTVINSTTNGPTFFM